MWLGFVNSFSYRLRGGEICGDINAIGEIGNHIFIVLVSETVMLVYVYVCFTYRLLIAYTFFFFNYFYILRLNILMQAHSLLCVVLKHHSFYKNDRIETNV